MKKISFTPRLPALALAVALAGAAAATFAQTERRPSPPPVPQNRFQSDRDRYGLPYSSRDLRSLIEDLESSSPQDVNSGRIGRFFTNPAVIITNGRMHHIDWNRVRDDQLNDRSPRDRADRSDGSVRDDTRVRDDREDRRNSDVRVEDFQTRTIDPRTMVVMYTAVLPRDNGFFHQPVVATLIRESESRGWRVASYTAEDAAIPGGADAVDDEAPLPAR